MKFLKDYFLLILMLGGFFSLIVLVAVNPFVLTQPAPGQLEGQETLVVALSDGRFLQYGVDLALTPEAHKQGLMNKDFIPPQYGMLFVFAGDEERHFWMKDTLVPLDMIFLNVDGTIHHIHEMAKPHDETMISSNGPVRAVLELSGGQVAANGIEVGDVVRHSFFGNAP